MTAAQPNNPGIPPGGVGRDVEEVAGRDVEPPRPTYVGDLPDDPEEARQYRRGDDARPGDDEPDEGHA